MPESRRLDPAAVAAQLRRRWTNGHRAWLDGGGTWPLAILLGTPTERETRADLAGVRAWVESWLEAERSGPLSPSLAEAPSPPAGHPGRMPGPSAMDGKPSAGTTAQEHTEPPAELLWTDRQWPGLGRQKLPERLLLPGPDALARWIGDGTRWARAQGRARHIRDALHLPGLALGRHFDWLAEAPAPEFQRLLAAVRWLAEHPGCGLYLRQLPIPGIDTKWIAANRTRVTDLLRQVRGHDGDLDALSGLRREPDLLRLRILDPGLRLAAGGLSDLSAPIPEIAALPLAPAQVLLVENLQTGLALPELPGTVVLMARGYAVEVFDAIHWLKDRPCHYWGDLDTHGFAILSRLRHSLPNARSLLMDAETLLAHRALWQQEDTPAAGPLGGLGPAEQAVYLGLVEDRWGERLRLEQERIDWDYACRRIAETLASSPR
jgi:hypothetical protein